MRKNGFAGRYYKHQKGDKSLCVIHGSSDSGDFIQIITNNEVFQDRKSVV